ncbi:M55 family metallopeptidase [Nonomuraea basaltis]|uniref:M55 family metallopeptidase n=1 Tax=Nonomuraea basaltis TaxID=2495887 RepID=UPI0023F206DC|nr:M55 family metallopeptidase [Nonomuraea basaltis]
MLRAADIGRNCDVARIFCDIERPSGSNGGYPSPDNHARAGANGAVLAHSMADAILDVRINGVSHGETGIDRYLG